MIEREYNEKTINWFTLERMKREQDREDLVAEMDKTKNLHQLKMIHLSRDLALVREEIEWYDILISNAKDAIVKLDE